MNKKLQELCERGIILINKEAGRTSHDEVAFVKSILRRAGVVTKVGHSGTLDPKVTGLLVLGLGKGTKVLEYMLLSEKQYIGEMVFHAHATREQLESAIREFTGSIEQLPPRKSAVKREVRTRDVYKIEIQSFDYENKNATLLCAVERGTYIRKLFHDMGEYMGIRSHMGDLHRIKVGPFAEEEGMVTSKEFADVIMKTKSFNPFVRFRALQQAKLLIRPIEDAVPMFWNVILHPTVERHIGSGADVYIPGVESIDAEAQVGDTVGVYTNDRELIALGVLRITSADLAHESRGVAVETKKILI